VAEADFQRYFSNAVKDEWEEQTIEFTAPANAATVLLRYYGGGEAYLDDVSLIGEKPVNGVPATNLKNPVPGAEDMISNGSFEGLQEQLKAKMESDTYLFDTGETKTVFKPVGGASASTGDLATMIHSDNFNLTQFAKENSKKRKDD